MALGIEGILGKINLSASVIAVATLAYASPSYPHTGQHKPAVENEWADDDMTKDYEGIENVNFKYALPRGISPLRKATECIVLHTTEGRFRGSLDKLWWDKETHMIIDRDGTIYPLIPLDNVAYHAGISRWNGKELLEKNCISIEFVDNLTNFLTDAQYVSGGKIAKHLKRRGNLTDEEIVGHFQVAYQRLARNGYKPARGRKNDGRIIDRIFLGIGPWPEDPDIGYGMLPSTPTTNPQFYVQEDQVAGIKRIVSNRAIKENPKLPAPKFAKAKFSPASRRR